MREMGPSGDFLKLLAVLAMLAGHAAHVLGGGWGILRTILIDLSYVTAPIMCFFLAEGYACTRSFRRYLERMLVFALISEIPFRWAFGDEAACLDILFTLALGLVILKVTDPLTGLGEERRKQLLILLFGLSIFMDWGVSAPYLILRLGEAKRSGRSYMEAFKAWLPIHAVMCILSGISELGWAAGILDAAGQMIGPLAAMFLLAFYKSERRGKRSFFIRWFFYGFYPVHLVILCLLRMQ